MTVPANRGLRRGLAAILILALAPAPARPVIAGVVAPVCRAGADEGPARDASRHCCGDCALLAAAVLPSPPRVVRPVPVERSAARARAVLRASVAARPRDHRLPRGPPAA